jgi:hypothetical protein
MSQSKAMDAVASSYQPPPSQGSVAFSNPSVLSNIMRFATQSPEHLAKLGLVNTHTADIRDTHGGAVYRNLLSQENVDKASDKGDMRTLINFVNITHPPINARVRGLVYPEEAGNTARKALPLPVDNSIPQINYTHAMLRLGERNQVEDVFWLIERIDSVCSLNGKPCLDLDDRIDDLLTLAQSAAENNNLDFLKELHRRGVDMDDEGSILAIACDNQNVEMIRFLTELDEVLPSAKAAALIGERGNVEILEIVSGSEDKWSDVLSGICFTHAVYAGHAGIMQYIEDNLSTDLDADFVGDTPKSSNPEVYRLLIKGGYYQHSDQESDATAVFAGFCAGVERDVTIEDAREIIGLLKELNPNLDVNYSATTQTYRDLGRIGGGSLDVAISRNIPNLIQALILEGANPNTPRYLIRSIIRGHQMDNFLILFPYIDRKEYSGLISQCVENGFDEAITFLLSRGASINGEGDVMISAVMNSDGEYIVHSDQDEYQEGYKWTPVKSPLLHAIEMRSEKYVDMLLGFGADIRLSQITPYNLSQETRCNHMTGDNLIPILKVFAKRKIDWSTIADGEDTLLDTLLPFESTNFEAIYVILSGGKNNLMEPRTLKNLAHRPELVEALINKVLLNPNAKTDGTPIVSFFLENHGLEAVRRLMRYGATLTKEDKRKFREDLTEYY